MSSQSFHNNHLTLPGFPQQNWVVMVENQNIIQCFLNACRNTQTIIINIISNLNLTGNPPYRGTKGNFVNSYNLRNHPATRLQSSIHNYLSMLLKGDTCHEKKNSIKDHLLRPTWTERMASRMFWVYIGKIGYKKSQQ